MPFTDDPQADLERRVEREREAQIKREAARSDEWYGDPYERQNRESYAKAKQSMLAKPQMDLGGLKATSGAEGQMWQGIAQQQQLGMAQAGRRGFNPMAARAAGQAGAELEGMGRGQAAVLRAQDEAARRAAALGLAQQYTQAGFQQQDLATQRFQDLLNRQAFEQAQAKAMQAADEEETAKILTGIATGGISVAAGAMKSDERDKENVRDGGSEADRRLKALMQTIKVGGDPLAAATNEDGRSGSAGSPRVFFPEGRLMPQNSNPSVIRVPEMIIGSESPPMTERDREIAAAMGGDDAEALLRRREADRRSAQLLEALGQTDARVMQQLGMPERAQPVRTATAADDQRARDLTAGLEELGAVTTRKLGSSSRETAKEDKARQLIDALNMLGARTTQEIGGAPNDTIYRAGDSGYASPGAVQPSPVRRVPSQAGRESNIQRPDTTTLLNTRPLGMPDESVIRVPVSPRLKGSPEQYMTPAFAPSPVTYEYRPGAKAYGEGRQLGVMAQDMARSPELRPAVIETGDGLAVDGARAGYAALPLIGRLTERLEKLEKKGK